MTKAIALNLPIAIGAIVSSEPASIDFCHVRTVPVNRNEESPESDNDYADMRVKGVVLVLA